MDRKDVSVIILLLVLIATAYSWRQNCGDIAPAYDLSSLADLPIGTNAVTIQQLVEPQFWATVNSEWSGDIVQLLPQTVIGFINSSEDWRNWALANMPNPPS